MDTPCRSCRPLTSPAEEHRRPARAWAALHASGLLLVAVLSACGGSARQDVADAAIDGTVQQPPGVVDADARDGVSVTDDASATTDTDSGPMSDSNAAKAPGDAQDDGEFALDARNLRDGAGNDAQALMTDGRPEDSSFDAGASRALDAGPVCPKAVQLRGCDGHLVYTYDNPDSGYPMDGGPPPPIQAGLLRCQEVVTPMPAHLSISETDAGAQVTLTLPQPQAPLQPCLPDLAWDGSCSKLRSTRGSFCDRGISFTERWIVEGCTLDPSASGLHLTCGAYYFLANHNQCDLSVYTVFDFRCDADDAGGGTSDR